MILDGNKLRKRSNNVWELRITRNGVNKSFYGKTQDTVKAKYFKYKAENKPIQKIIDKSITLAQWAEKWLITYKKPFIADSTYKILTYTIRKHIINGEIGQIQINKLTNIELQNYLNSLEAIGNTRSKLKFYLKDMIRKAVDNNIIKNNFADSIKTVAKETTHCVALNKNEQSTLKNYNFKDEILKKYYLFCLYSGCRRSEALNFKLSDIKENYIHIKGTKTKQSNRYIPLFKPIADLLKNETNNEPFKSLKPDYVTRHFKEALPNHILKDLRRTFATNCYEAGIKDKTIQKWLGHTNVKMTNDNYIEIKTKFEFSEAEKINDFSTQI